MNLRLITIVGARPQFIKAAAVSRIIARHNALLAERRHGRAISELIIHTGQHFDANMSDVFFEQLQIPVPQVNLGISGACHGAMTGQMLEAIEVVLMKERPDWVLVYGDTNSTLAGALAAVKRGIPVAHVESGLRSHNADMPEEVNRVIADRVSTLLLCPTQTAVENLKREGFPFPVPSRRSQQIALVGDVMFDSVLQTAKPARERIPLSCWTLKHQGFALCTLHRQENTDSPERLSGILAGLRRIAESMPVVLPLHPRTRKVLGEDASSALAGLQIVEPQPFLEMQRLLMSAKVVLTDSGGLQKEAYFHKVPCITLRDETEWVETVASGWNRLVGADPLRIVEAFETAVTPRAPQPQVFGDGKAAERIVSLLLQ